MSGTTQFDDIETSRIVWHGIGVEVRFNRRCLGRPASASHPCHIEVRVVSPATATLPVTDTGYRSHFTGVAAVDAAGGAVAYVTAWLECCQGRRVAGTGSCRAATVAVLTV